jgi:hypothetical protein
MLTVENRKDTSKHLAYANTHPSAQINQGKSYLFAIGIDRYKYCNKLLNAVKDAKEVVQLLTSKYQFELQDVSGVFDEEATRENIYRKLDEYTRSIRAEDTLLLYYSGHGIYLEELEEGFWIPVEGKLNDTSSYISNSDISKRLRAIKALHIVVISDSCFSGSLFGERAVYESLQKLESIQSRWLFTSGRNTPVLDGLPGKNSPFADNLLYHLENNKQKKWSLTDLSRLIINAVANNSNQLPRCEPLRDTRHRGGEFMFRLKGVLQEPISPGDRATSIPASVDVPGSHMSRKLVSWMVTILTITALIVITFRHKELPNVSKNPDKKDEVITKNDSVKIDKEDSVNSDRHTNTKVSGETTSRSKHDKVKSKEVDATIPSINNRDSVGKTEIESPTVIKMCNAICETKGITGVEVTFTDRKSDSTYTLVSNDNDLVFKIPCSSLEEHPTVSVRFKKGNVVETRNVKLERFQLPEMFKTN